MVSVVALVAVFIVMTLKLPTLFGEDPPPVPETVAVSLPVWNLDGGSRTIAAHASSFTSASPSLYEVGPAGEIVSRPQPEGVSVEDGLRTLRARDVPIVPIVSNTSDLSWNPRLIRTILHDADLVEQHIESIVTLVRQEDFAGIDIDYEELAADDRDAFSRFIARLADALHAEDKILSVDVFAKSSDQGYDDRNEAQDYAALGRAADQVRLMAYDWHWQSGPAGPIAPAGWVRSALSYAVSEIPAEKVVLGIPTYGYAWAGPVGSEGRLVSWLAAYGLSQELDVPVQWDETAQSPWFMYQDDQGVDHTIWFENSQSITAKLELAQTYRIGGVFVWLVGDEDDGIWPVIGDFADGENTKAGGNK
jgi:spore germination protein